MPKSSNPPTATRKVLRALLTKTWLETRSRFLISALAMTGLCMWLVLSQGPLRERLSGVAAVANHGPLSELASLYSRYLQRFVYAGALEPLAELFAVVLAMGGLQKERELGITGLTLSLPVTRSHLTTVRAIAGIGQVALIALIPAVLIPVLSALVGDSYPASQSFSFFLLWTAAHAAVFSAAMLVSSLVSNQITALLVAGLWLITHSMIALLPVLQPFKLRPGWIASGTTMPYLDPVTGLLTGLPWTRLLILLLVSSCFIAATARVTEHQDY